jgi:hypothetical protein
MSLSPSHIEAYQKTTYRVWTGTEGIEFGVGARFDALDRLLETQDVRTAIFITAHNPFSQVVSIQENQTANLRLLIELRNRRRFQVLKGRGSLGDWSEPSFLALGADIDLLLNLVSRYRQNAAVFIALGKKVELVIAPQAGLLSPVISPQARMGSAYA